MSSGSPGLQAQVEAYTRGSGHGGGQTLPYAVEEWERRARERLSPARFSYVACGAGAEDTCGPTATRSIGFEYVRASCIRTPPTWP